MGFLGRGRGGQRGKGRGGGIHASTQKPKDRERSKSSSSSAGRDRDRDGRGSSASANKDADDTKSNKFDSKDFSKESLRITVGNDMYREQSRQSKSPLSDRLGPPVDRNEQKQRSEFDDNLYKQEQKFYGERGNTRGEPYDRDHRSSRDSNDRRQDHYRDDRGRPDRDDRGRPDRDDRKDRRERRDDNRDYPDRRRDEDRHGSSYDDRGRGYGDDGGRGMYKDPVNNRPFDSHLDSDHRGGMPGPGNYPPVAIPPAPKPLKSILKKATPASTTSIDNQSATHASVYSTPNPAGPIDRVGGLFPVQDRQGPEGMLRQRPQEQGPGGMFGQRSQEQGPGGMFRQRSQEPPGRQQYESNLPASGSGGRQRSGLPGMSSYMDIEDEEKFLYGDVRDDDKMDGDHRDRFLKNKPPPYDRQQMSHPSQMDFNRPPVSSNDQQMHPRPDISQLGSQLSALRSNSLEAQLTALRNGGIESQLAALKASGFGSQLSSLNLNSGRMDSQIPSQPSPNYNNPLSNLAGNFPNNSMQQDPYSRPQEPPINTQAPINPQGSGYTNDLLSIFTNNSLASVQPSVPQPQQQPQPSPQPVEEKQPGYDPTIENILKSIGFDFEMSKRMQEKAQKAPKEEEVFGINEGASFLEGGLSDDIKKKLFKQKEESMVDKFLREVKSRPAYAAPQGDTDFRHERNQEGRRDSRDSERKHERYDDKKYDRDDNRRSRSRSHSVDRRYKRSPDRRHRHSRSRSRTPERKISRERPSDKRYGHKRTRSRSIELRYSRSRSNSWSDSDSLSSISSNDSHGRRYKKPRAKRRSRSPLDGNQASTYPTKPLDSLSSGIPFHRQMSSSDQFPAYTQNAAPPPIYTQPSYPPPPGGPYGPPPGMYPDVPPPVGWPQTVPPFNYNMPPPGYMPPGQAPPSTYPHYPDSQVPPGSNIHPPGTVPVSITPEKPAVTPVSSSGLKSSDGRTRTLQAVQVDRGISKSSKSESSKKSEDVVEKKTITIEKKTISITSSESNRTVIPPKKDSSKSSTVSESKSSSKRPAESPKKVLTTKDRNRLIKERDLRKKRIDSLEEELRKLKRQQNEIMRKKRRQKDGHKDPVLLQNSKLQDEISTQISKLRKLSDEGLKTLRESVVKDDKDGGPPAAKKVKDMFKDNTPDKSQKKSSRQSSKEMDTDKGKEDKKSDKEKMRYDFFDPGGHWCKVCNVTSGSIYSVLQHLHAKKHQQNMNQYDRPWVPGEMSRPPKIDPKMKVVTLPVKGQEFLVPCKAFYCTLCEEFAGDEACADFHLKSESHYQKYEKFMSKNSMYETRLQLDRKTSFAKAEKEKKEVVNKKQTPEEKQQAEKRVKDKEKKWEKEVDELEDLKDPLQKAGFDKFPQKLKGPMELKKPKDEPKKEEPVEEPKKDSEGKSKIEIHIASKRVMPTPMTGKMPGKKNALLPPWTPVSKQEGAKGSAKLTMPLRKQPTKVQTGKPASLDLFLSIENGDKAKPLPVVSKLGEGKQKVTAKDILEAFSGKRKDENALQVEETPAVEVKKEENAAPVEEKPKTPEISQEDIADMKMLGIDPEEHQPIAEIKVPPPPSQNLSLPEKYQKQLEESKITSDEITAVKVKEENIEVSVPSVPEISIPVESPIKLEQKNLDDAVDVKLHVQADLSDIQTATLAEPVVSDIITPDIKKEDSESISVPDQSQLEAAQENVASADTEVSLEQSLEEVPSTEIQEEDKFCDELLKASSDILDMNLNTCNTVPTVPPETVNVVETVVSEETSNKDEQQDVSEDIDDAVSDASGISMHMGSDFEVLDECQDDEVGDL